MVAPLPLAISRATVPLRRGWKKGGRSGAFQALSSGSRGPPGNHLEGAAGGGADAAASAGGGT